ncbi:MAG: FAD-dependent oxidoreductase [Desulfobacterota bacterium]|nr:FAD-dependent oxidoreductase [Thermodesulfobacteriota bacterium]MDW8001409.1 FAD-dependent oxidoreductase [Deltaproteobacteria bacterium]
MERLDVIIVGGGLAGLSCAYGLKDSGLSVLVLERGEFPGTKNMTGGRLYLNPVYPYMDGMFDDSVLERKIVRERWTLLAKNSSLTFDFTSEKLRYENHSYTVLRGRLDKHIAEKLLAQGVLVVPKYRVDGLIMTDGKVDGVTVGDERLYANVVVIAEGALSILTRRLGLKEELKANDYAVGIKEVIGLSANTINERFNVGEREGVAHLFIGDVTEGIFGGGFLYTNIDTVSLGIVVKISSVINAYPKIKTYELLERFKERFEIKTLIREGETLEYSAHLIPEAGFRGCAKLYGNGVLIVGDAAGLALNMGFTVRGMDFAIVSGILAAETIKEAYDKGDFSESVLKGYADKLKESFVLKDLNTFRHMPDFLDNDDIFAHYPEKFPAILEKLTYFGCGPKGKTWDILWPFIKEMVSLRTIKVLLSAKKI